MLENVPPQSTVQAVAGDTDTVAEGVADIKLKCEDNVESVDRVPEVDSENTATEQTESVITETKPTDDNLEDENADVENNGIALRNNECVTDETSVNEQGAACEGGKITC